MERESEVQEEELATEDLEGEREIIRCFLSLDVQTPPPIHTQNILMTYPEIFATHFQPKHFVWN